MLLAGRYASLQVAFPEPLTQLLFGGIIAGGFLGYPHTASKCFWLSLGEDE